MKVKIVKIKRKFNKNKMKIVFNNGIIIKTYNIYTPKLDVEYDFDFSSSFRDIKNEEVKCFTLSKSKGVENYNFYIKENTIFKDHAKILSKIIIPKELIIK